MTLPTTATVAAPADQGYGCSLNSTLFRLAAAPGRPLVTQTADNQAPRFTTEAHPEENLPAFGDVYALAKATGEGLLERFRRRGTESDPTRFWASQGVDVSPTADGVPQEMRLLTTTSEVDDTSADPCRLANSGDSVWATNGQSLRKSTDAGATWANNDPHDGEGATDVEDVATLGDVPYAALGANGIHRDTGAGWAHWADVAAVRVWEALDRIVASTGTALYEAAAGAGSVLLYTLPSGTEWTDVVDAGAAILASASNGYVYAFTLDASAALEVTAQTKITGETPTSLASGAGTVWVGTADGDDARLWEFVLTDGLTLGAKQLVREWDTASVGRILATRDTVLIGVKEGTEGWCWRLELANSGLFRAERLGDGDVDGLAVIDGVLVAGVSTDGVFRQTSTLVSEAWLIGPLVDFFRGDVKSFVTAWADVKVPAGQVELYVTDDRDALFDEDHASWRRVRTYTADSENVEVGLDGITSRALAGMVKMSPESNTGPTVRSFSFRAYPGAGDVVVTLPVDVGDQVERRGKRRAHVRGWGQQVLEALRDLEGEAVLCEVFRTGDVVRGQIRKVETPIPALTPLGSATQVSFVTVQGRRVASRATDIGVWALWGNATWGSARWGGPKQEVA